MKTLVVADIHGYNDLLTKVIDYYETLEDTRLVFVGDYIDRGPDSYNCLNTVKELVEKNPNKVFALMGNHEELFLDFLEVPYYSISNGLSETIKSFKIPFEDTYEFNLENIKNFINDEHAELIDWVKNLPLYYEDEQVIVAHAGVSMKDQESTSKDFLLWAREEYMLRPNTLNKPIITGHTITTGVDYILRNSKTPYKHLGSVIVTEDLKYFIDGGVFLDKVLNTVLFEDGKMIEHKCFKP